MLVVKLIPCSAVAAMALLASAAWSAPAPAKEKPAPKVADEEAVESFEMDRLTAAKNRAMSSNNLKQIAIAVHNFASASTTSVQIPQNIVTKDGKRLLSWRVHLLPYLEQAELYKQFKLDEPWDSDNNIKLLEKMPKLFLSPRVKVKKAGYTTYLGFEGNGALFGSKYNIGNIPDGTSNTILCVESSIAVPWTKPIDLPFDPKKDVANFGKAYGDRPCVGICDGSVRTLDMKKLTQATLKNAICTDDGNPLGADW